MRATLNNLPVGTKTSAISYLDQCICKAYANDKSIGDYTMKRAPTGKNKAARWTATAKLTSNTVAKRASIFRNGTNQAVRLPQELRFPAEVKEVRIRKQGDGLLLSPIKPNWASFFAIKVDVPDDFLESRDDSPPQSRDPL